LSAFPAPGSIRKVGKGVDLTVREAFGEWPVFAHSGRLELT
jgi:hypothetical protein